MDRQKPGFFSSRIRSFQFAFAGWWHVIRTQPNAWIHALASAVAILLAIWLNLSIQNWAILLLTMALVWTAEFFNTALEATVDLFSPQPHPLAKIGKDVAAGAVLISALASFLVGLLILGPPLLSRLGIIIPNH